MIVDGNALAGMLTGIVGSDPTTSVLHCSGCGGRAVLARARVYHSAMGSVVRCVSCDQVLLTVVDDGTKRRLTLIGCCGVEVGWPEPE